jgi:hypothetical protein
MKKKLLSISLLQILSTSCFDLMKFDLLTLSPSKYTRCRPGARVIKPITDVNYGIR